MRSLRSLTKWGHRLIAGISASGFLLSVYFTESFGGNVHKTMKLLGLNDTSDVTVVVSEIGQKLCISIPGTIGAHLTLMRVLSSDTGKKVKVDKSDYVDSSSGYWNLGIVLRDSSIKIISVDQAEFDLGVWNKDEADSYMHDTFCLAQLHVVQGHPTKINKIVLEGSSLWLYHLPML